MIAWMLAWVLGWVVHAQGAGDCGPAVPDVVPTLQQAVGPAPGPTSDTVVVDASSLLSRGPDPMQLAEILRGVANEPGEEGRIAFDFTAGGRIGTGVVNGEVEGAVGLDVVYGVDDRNLVTLEMDYDLALKAGISLEGLVSFGGKVEGGGSFLKLGFDSSYDAAAWLTHQLERINDRTGNRLWPDATNLPSYAPPLVMDTGWTAAGVYADAGPGRFGFKGEGKYKVETTTIHATENGRLVESNVRTEHLIGQATFEVPFGKGTASVGYTYDRNATSGSPVYYANGVATDHRVSIKIPTSAFERILRESPGAPSEAVQDLVLDVFAKVEAVAPGSALKNINYKAFSAVTDQLYAEAGKKSHLHGERYLTLDVAWSYAQDPDGGESLLYTRFYVGGQQVVGLEGDVKAVHISGQVSGSKTELVWDSIGTRTVSYVQRQFLYQTPDRRWEDFKRANEDQLRELVRNVATDTSSPYYDERVAEAWKKGGYPAAMSALERVWTEQDREHGRVRQAASRIAEASNRWQFPWRKDDLQREIAGLLEGIDDPADRRYAWELVDDYGGSYARIFALMDPDTPDGDRLTDAVLGVLDDAEKAGIRLAALAEKQTWSRNPTIRARRTESLQNQVASVLEQLTPPERQVAWDFARTIGGDVDRLDRLVGTGRGTAGQRRLAAATRGLTR